MQEQKTLLKKYLICFGVAFLMAFLVLWREGFLKDDVAVNLQILSDCFCVSGLLLTLFAGLLFISGEGAFIGIGFVMRNVVLAFVPMGRAKHESYAKYRERKLGTVKKQGDHCILITGLLFLSVGIVFSVVWYLNFYQMPA